MAKKKSDAVGEERGVHTESTPVSTNKMKRSEARAPQASRSVKVMLDQILGEN